MTDAPQYYFPVIPNWFNCAWYHKTYPGVKLDPYYGENPERAWEHYIKHGYLEGRKIKIPVKIDEFCPDKYLEAYPGVAKSEKYKDNPYRHYIDHGFSEGRNPCPSIINTSPYFEFFGKRKFLTAISYFDALRARYPEHDLDYMKSKGIDMVRVYLNFSYPPNRVNGRWHFLFQQGGSLDNLRLKQLKRLITLCGNRQMIVDISSSRRLDGVDGKPNGWQMSPSVYADCWTALAIELKKLGRKNILIDAENEHNNESDNMTISQANYVRERIQRHLPDVYITASVASHISPEAGAALAKAEGMNTLGFHDPRTPSCVQDTEPLAIRCKKAFPNGVVYFQEPSQYGWQDFVKGSDDLIAMYNGAKRAKIGAWCLHNNVFTSSHAKFQNLLHPVEREFMNRLSGI